jgi:hypothetical protein
MSDRVRLKNQLTAAMFLLIILFGFAVRIRQYAVGASLWVDEAALSLNIIRLSPVELMRPLDFLQGAPAGFLWLEKLAVTLGGDGEMWLRLVPLLSGLLILVLFPLVARHYLSRNANLLALSLLVLSERLIYYSSEVKQYSLDVLVTITGLALFLFLRGKPLTIGRVAAAAIIGAALLWLSHPAVFILGMTGLYILIATWRQGDRFRLMLVLFVGLTWLTSFVVLAVLTLEDLIQNDLLLAFWAGGFPPPVVTGIHWLYWHWHKFNLLPEFGLGLAAGGVAFLFGLSGVVSFYRRDKALLFSLVVPIGLLLLASWLKRYPLSDRMILFTAPLVAILIAQGTEHLSHALRSISRPLAYALPVFLLVEPVMQTWDLVRQPQYKEELAPVLEYVRRNWQEGDHIYLYYSSYLAFEYYRPRYGFSEEDFTVGVNSRNAWLPYFQELNALAEEDRRVWMIFSHVYTESGANEEALFTNYLNQKGELHIDSYHAHQASAYLYDFRQ